ncbi:MAG: Xaa-Pro peptidase family protein [Gemmatimonadaceae bacterium]
MDRRGFVVTMSAAAVAPIADRVRSSVRGGHATPEDGRGRAPTFPPTNISVASTYPPISPLEADVFSARLNRLRDQARGAGANIVIATSGCTNFQYLAGADFGRSERLIALLVPVEGSATVVAPAFEGERVRRGLRVPARIVAWEEQDDPLVALKRALPIEAPLALLLEPTTEYRTASAIGTALPGARLIDGAAVFETLRLVKTPEEIVRMRRAIAITEDAIAATFDRLEVGMSDAQVAQGIAAEHAARGVVGGALVQFGSDSALPHGHPSGATLQEGTVVLVDGGCKYEGYSSDITRTRWFGAEPSDEFRHVYRVVRDAQDAAMAVVRPGVAAQELDRAARGVIARAGYGRNFTHRLGHGMGMDGHEPTWNVEGNTTVLQPGFVFSVEPGVYLPGKFGVRLEDDYMCTRTGGELLSRRAGTV